MLLENAFILATVTFVGGYMVWQKLPRRLRRWLQEQSLMTDVVLLYLGYLILGGTATAMLAAAILGLFVTVALYIANHPEQFGWLFDIVADIRSTFVDLTINETSTELVPAR